MNRCLYIREHIDEAEKPDVFPFEVAEHIGQCNECEAFAAERTALRKLIAGDSRVSAPINFDAVLNARLAEVKARRTFWRLGSPAFLRLGAATAGLIVMIFAAQYTGIFSKEASPPPKNPEVARAAPLVQPAPIDRTPETVKPTPSELSVAQSMRQNPGSPGAQRIRRGDLLVGRTAPAGYLSAEDGGVVLVRGRNGDMDVQMPTVSVGAQPLLYVSAGQRPVRNAGASF